MRTVPLALLQRVRRLRSWLDHSPSWLRPIASILIAAGSGAVIAATLVFAAYNLPSWTRLSLGEVIDGPFGGLITSCGYACSAAASITFSIVVIAHSHPSPSWSVGDWSKRCALPVFLTALLTGFCCSRIAELVANGTQNSANNLVEQLRGLPTGSSEMSEFLGQALDRTMESAREQAAILLENQTKDGWQIGIVLGLLLVTAGAAVVRPRVACEPDALAASSSEPSSAKRISPAGIVLCIGSIGGYLVSEWFLGGREAAAFMIVGLLVAGVAHLYRREDPLWPERIVIASIAIGIGYDLLFGNSLIEKLIVIVGCATSCTFVLALETSLPMSFANEPLGDPSRSEPERSEAPNGVGTERVAIRVASALMLLFGIMIMRRSARVLGDIPSLIQFCIGLATMVGSLGFLIRNRLGHLGISIALGLSIGMAVVSLVYTSLIALVGKHLEPDRDREMLETIQSLGFSAALVYGVIATILFTYLKWPRLRRDCGLEKGDRFVRAVKTRDLALAHSAIRDGLDLESRLSGFLLTLTPLGWAVHYANREIVEALLDSGANPRQNIGWGYLFKIPPATYAERRRLFDLAKLLESHAASESTRQPDPSASPGSASDIETHGSRR